MTILAYGQTGSGKTFSMGTCYNGEGEMGIIPRAICDIFEKISATVDKEVSASFMEVNIFLLRMCVSVAVLYGFIFCFITPSFTRSSCTIYWHAVQSLEINVW